MRRAILSRLLPDRQKLQERRFKRRLNTLAFAFQKLQEHELRLNEYEQRVSALAFALGEYRPDRWERRIKDLIDADRWNKDQIVMLRNEIGQLKNEPGESRPS